MRQAQFCRQPSVPAHTQCTVASSAVMPMCSGPGQSLAAADGRLQSDCAPDDEDAVLQVRQLAEADGLGAVPEVVVLHRQARDVALRAHRQHRRHVLQCQQYSSSHRENNLQFTSFDGNLTCAGKLMLVSDIEIHGHRLFHSRNERAARHEVCMQNWQDMLRSMHGLCAAWGWGNSAGPAAAWHPCNAAMMKLSPRLKPRRPRPSRNAPQCRKGSGNQ